MKQINMVIDDLRYYIKNEELKRTFDELAKLIREENKFNLRANIEVGHISENSINVCDMEWGTDYEILTGHYTDDDGEEYTPEEREQKLEELQEKIKELEEEQDKLGIDNARKYNYLSGKIVKLEDEYDDLDDADFEYDEIYWNNVYNYDGYVNTGLAQRLGFGVLEHDGEEYMFLQGCGMDLSPKFIAYQALEFGAIDPSYVHKWESPDYVKHVMGEEIFNEVIKRLGIEDCIQTAIEKQKKSMKEFDEKLKRITELRNSGEIDQTMTGLMGLMILSKNLSNK